MHYILPNINSKTSLKQPCENVVRFQKWPGPHKDMYVREHTPLYLFLWETFWCRSHWQIYLLGIALNHFIISGTVAVGWMVVNNELDGPMFYSFYDLKLTDQTKSCLNVSNLLFVNLIKNACSVTNTGFQIFWIAKFWDPHLSNRLPFIYIVAPKVYL